VEDRVKKPKLIDVEILLFKEKIVLKNQLIKSNQRVISKT
jgi:hypothetical protein